MWSPVFVLPNIHIREQSAYAITCGPIAIASWYDPRISKLRADHPTFNMFCSNFQTTFQRSIKPCFLIRNDEAPSSPNHRDADRLGSIRDMLSVSTIGHQLTQSILYPSGHGHIMWSDYFTFHPCMISNDWSFITQNTFALLSIDDPKRFKGQAWPHISVFDLDDHKLNTFLLDHLIERWKNQYLDKDTSHHNLALFRSLNMAHQAMLMPSQTASFLEIGRCLGLWLSAFECLLHPGGASMLTLDMVIKYLNEIDWKDRFGKGVTYNIPFRKNAILKANIAGYLYKQLYDARNRFLHGNPVTEVNLRIEGTDQDLIIMAPVLYQLALTRYLGLDMVTQPSPDPSNLESLTQYNAFLRNTHSRQVDIERALYLCTLSSEQRIAFESQKRRPRI